MRSIIAVILTAFLLFSVAGCGRDKKAEQSPVKTTATQEVKKEAPKEKTAFIVGTEVNAREKASIDSGIVGTYDLGEKVTILADEGEWAKVKRANGQECYVFKKFLGDQAALDKRQATTIKRIPNSEFVLGNIALDDSIEHVKGVYGTPTDIKVVNNQYVNSTTLKYGNSLIIVLYNGKVGDILTTSNNGIATPSGIHVGSTVVDVNKMYGKPETNVEGFEHRKDIITFKNSIDKNNPYVYDRYFSMLIKEGKVAELRLTWAPSY